MVISNTVMFMHLARIIPAALLLASASLHASLHWERTHLSVKPPADGGEVVGVFPFTNQGETSISLTNTMSSCGCTVAELSKRIYAPGESGEILVVFKPGDRTGPQRNTVTVTTDDPSQPQVRLVLETDIPVPASLQPRIQLWRLGSEPEWKESKISLSPGWKLLPPEVPPGIELQVIESEDKPLEPRLRLRPQTTAERMQHEQPLLFEGEGGERREIKFFLLVR